MKCLALFALLIVPLFGCAQIKTFEDLPKWSLEVGGGTRGYAIVDDNSSYELPSRPFEEPENWGLRLALRRQIGSSRLFMELGARHSTWVRSSQQMNRLGFWLGMGSYIPIGQVVRINLNTSFLGITNNYDPFERYYSAEEYRSHGTFIQIGIGVHRKLGERFWLGVNWTGVQDGSPLYSRPHPTNPKRSYDATAAENLLSLTVGWCWGR